MWLKNRGVHLFVCTKGWLHWLYVCLMSVLALQLVEKWRSAPQCYNLFLQLHQHMILEWQSEWQTTYAKVMHQSSLITNIPDIWENTRKSSPHPQDQVGIIYIHVKLNITTLLDERHIHLTEKLKTGNGSVALLLLRIKMEGFCFVLYFKHSLKLALDKIKLSLHMLQCKQAPGIDVRGKTFYCFQ